MSKVYKALIIEVEPGSVSQKNGIEPGDSLLMIDDNPLRDFLDYQFAISGAEKLELLIEKADQCQKNVVIYKKANEDLGLTFESAVFDRIKPCNNRCIFCFVDQQPPGLRESLYIKDDDYRLSYLQGTYITLTNLNEKDKKRIEQLRLGPLYVSVHTTNPSLRELMLNNPKASEITTNLKWLEELYIPIHTQIVVCPGINDGEELFKSLKDLANLENVLSVAVVPVGITKYREGSVLKPFNKKIATKTLEIIDSINEEKGFNFVFPSDEIFLCADKPLPEENFYNSFPQLEDGVGAVRLTISEFNELKLPDKLESPKYIGVITGNLAAKALTPLYDRIRQIENLKLDVIQIDNDFWGQHISVCGLIVGSDIIEKLEQCNKIPPEIFLPSVMLRKYSSEFLDGVKIEDIEKRFNIKITVIKDFYSFKELIEQL